MTHSKKILILAVFAAGFSTAAQAGDWSNSGSYNGYGAFTQNNNSAFSLRDSNNNMTVVDGQFRSANYSNNSGAQSASAGVGTSGAGSAYGQASAIGNSLNVVTIGSYNTVIVNSQQTNTGNQTASVDLNQH